MRLEWLMIAVLGLTACGDSKPPDKSVFDAQVQAVRKARAVEGKMQEAAERQREAVEKADRGDDSAPK